VFLVLRSGLGQALLKEALNVGDPRLQLLEASLHPARDRRCSW
jgi:hypothetical protein